MSNAQPPAINLGAEGQELLQQVIGFYHDTLKQSPEAMDFLRSRGIDHPEAIERFKLGYANRTLGLTLPSKQLKAGAEIRGHLTEIGLYRDSGHEHFNGSLVIPVMDESGNIVQVYGRKLLSNLRKGTPMDLYLPGPMPGVWNAEALEGATEAILTLSLMDGLTFWCAGYRNVIAAYGGDGLTDEHLEALLKHGIKRVVIAFPGSLEGDSASVKVARQLSAHGIACFCISFPLGMDANSYVLKAPTGAQALKLLIQRAEKIGVAPAPGKAFVPFPPAVQTGNASAPTHPQNASPMVETPLLPSAAPTPSIPKERLHPEQATSRSDIVRMSMDEGSSSAPIRLPDASVRPPAQTTPSQAPAPSDDIPHEIQGNDLMITLAERCYRVRGWQKTLNPESLKVNLMVSRGEHFHVDSLDLYHAKARTAFIRQAGLELGGSEEVLKLELGKVLRKVEALQAELLEQALKSKDQRPELTAEEEAAARELLTAPNLTQRILEDFKALGVVGESSNMLTGYLAGVSRLLDRPLALLIQSASAAGKTSLLDAVLDLMPPEALVRYSAMTGQSVFYMGDRNLSHKILSISEEEGARQASYALKLLQSEGKVTMASTGKDPNTGMLTAHEYTVEGPVSLVMTTTAIDLDEELLNRCLVLTVDESREQTRAIHANQRARETLNGFLARQTKERLLTLHRNAQRLLEPLAVVNPYADQLSFQDHQTRSRRDHLKYLTLIRSIALLHQHQREVRMLTHEGQELSYIEVMPSDIALANELAQEVLGRSMDELLPQTRKLLTLLHGWVKDECQRLGIPQTEFRFSRKQVREALQWGDTQVWMHLGRLMEMEYLLPHRGRGKAVQYELLYQGEASEGRAKLLGLIDCTKLTGNIRGESADIRGAFGADSVGLRGDENEVKPSPDAPLPPMDELSPKDASCPSQKPKRTRRNADEVR